MICVYDGRDAERGGHGLGVIHPSECIITEETGGSYELSATLPLGGEWLLMERGNVVRAPGAPHRLSGQVQDFRIYGVELAEDGRSIRVQARHVFYDAANAFVQAPVEFDAAGVPAVLEAMGAAGEGVPYALDVQTGDATYTGSIDLVNWVNALLDPDAGIVAQARLRLERDCLTVRLRPEGGDDSRLTVRWGRNMAGLTRSTMIDQVVTRLQPVGEDAEGNPVYLPEKYVDSPRIGEYWRPLVSVWRVSGAKVGQRTHDADGNTAEMTLEDVHNMLRKAAQERLQSGCDLPKEKTSLAYVDMNRIGAADAAWAAAHVCLYDWLTIVHGPADVREQVQVTGYSWDVLRQTYTQLEVGDAFRDRTDTVIVTAPQLRKEVAAARKNSLRVEDLIDVEAEKIRLQARDIELIAYDVKDLDSRTSSAELRLDGMDGQITALGTDISDQGDVISQVLLDLNAAEADILLKAERTELDALATRVSSAEISLDAVEAEVVLRALKDDVEAEFKVQSDLISANAAAIALKADKIDLQGFVTMEEFESFEGSVSDLWADELKTLYVGAESVVAGYGDFDNLVFGAINGESSDVWVGEIVSGLGYATQAWVNGKGYATQSWVNSQQFDTVGSVNTKVNSLSNWVLENYPTKIWVNAQDYMPKSGLTTATTKVCTGTQYTTATTPPFFNANGTQVSGGITYVKSVTYNTTELTYLVYA
ncbi:MAG: hypothetical protein IJ438_01135 [Clostridia bacterium]|nr:hypothetical protein [Clostridia bacterium]MBQ8554452.1 hypothetical protein [Clostridia bacterium]